MKQREADLKGIAISALCGMIAVSILLLLGQLLLFVAAHAAESCDAWIEDPITGYGFCVSSPAKSTDPLLEIDMDGSNRTEDTFKVCASALIFTAWMKLRKAPSRPTEQMIGESRCA